MLRRIRLGILALPVALLAFHRVDAADVWLHLATGRLVWTTHAVPHHDIFGPAPALPWIALDWLAATGFFLLHALGGMPALVVATTGGFVLALCLPLAQASGTHKTQWPFEVALLATTLIAYERFFVRPEIVTLLLVAIAVQFFSAGAPRRWRTVAGLAVGQAVWANSHAAFLLGPGLAGLALAGHAIDTWRTERTWRVPAPLLALPFVALAACAVSPYGIATLTHAIGAWHAVGTPAMLAGIVEWQPTFAAPVAGDVTLMAFVASLVALAAAAIAARRQVHGFEALAVVAFVTLACVSRRHLLLYAATVPPLAAAWVQRRCDANGVARTLHRPAPVRTLRRTAGLIPASLAVWLAVDVARGGFYARCGPPRTLGWSVSAADHPLGAADFVVEHQLSGPLFNNVAAGSALVFWTGGTVPVWVDGRLLDAARFGVYRQALGSAPAFTALAHSQGFQLVVLALTPFPPVRLWRQLAGDPAWRLVFLDGEGAVFMATPVAEARGLAALRLDTPLPPASAPAGPAASVFHPCDPGEAGRRGHVLLTLGFAAAARADLTRALVQCPDHLEVWFDLGRATLETGDAPNAAALFERVVAADRSRADAWFELGRCHAALHDGAAARTCWERALALDPSDNRIRAALESLRR